MIIFEENLSSNGNKVIRQFSCYVGEQVGDDVKKISERIGTIKDTCCETHIRIGVLNPLILHYASLKGGFVAKNIYDDKIKQIFEIIYRSAKIKTLLTQRSLTIRKEQIENSAYLDFLKSLDNEIAY